MGKGEKKERAGKESRGGEGVEWKKGEMYMRMGLKMKG